MSLAGLHGVLVVDKPLGPTSHDVVARLRKLLGTRAIGHAGTLDPAASGVLVVAIGEATKLTAYLTAEDKAYDATVTFGASTTTLDAQGEEVETAPIPSDLARELAALAAQTRPSTVATQGAGVAESRMVTPSDMAAPSGMADLSATDGTARATPRGAVTAAADGASRAAPRSALATTSAPLLVTALDAERAREEQIPPAFSAIKTGGRVAHELARRGETVVLAPRKIAVKELVVTGATATTLDLTMRVSKGYYVRSLARDLGEQLGVPSHLSALRRVASGTFTLAEAVSIEATREAMESAMLPLCRAAARVLPAGRLTSEGCERARHGKPLHAEHFEAAPPVEVSAWIGPDGELVALGKLEPEGHFAPVRGFR